MIRRVIIALMVVIGGWSLSQVFVGIWICKPIAKFWNSALPGTCIPNIPQWYINAGGNILSDVTIFLFPMPILKNLNIKRRQKILVIGIFSLGFFTCAISIIRIKYLKQYADFSWENVASSCWSVSELSSAVTCLCLPTLKPLVQKVMPRLISSTAQSGPSSYGGHSSKGYHKHSEHGEAGPHSQVNTQRSTQRFSKGGAVTMTMTTDSQDELYPGDIELSAGLESKESVTVYAGSPSSPSSPAAVAPALANRDILGLRTTVRTKCAVDPSQPQIEERQETIRQIQVTRNVITQSFLRTQ